MLSPQPTRFFTFCRVFAFTVSAETGAKDIVFRILEFTVSAETGAKVSDRPPSTALDPCDRRLPITGVDFAPIWSGGSSNALQRRIGTDVFFENHRPELGREVSCLNFDQAG